MTTASEAIRGIPNAWQALPNLVTGGQPGPKHLEALKAAGAAVVLDIREPDEFRGFDEAAAVRETGMEYLNIPVGHTEFSDPLMEQVLGALRRHAGDLVLFHCASGNRCGGPLIAHLLLDHGMDEEDAIAVAFRGGLRSRALLDWGLDYARRHHDAGPGT
jgi:protein tyrosine phosphatase (PTP) superfamily phosphohydrolase (DUF442 family)